MSAVGRRYELPPARWDSIAIDREDSVWVRGADSLFRLRNLKLVTQAEFDDLKAAEEAGRGRELAAMLALPDTDDAADRNGFRHRVLSLALEAYRREQITRAKLVELAALLSMREEEVDQLLERAGLADGDSADVLIPGE